MLDLIKIYNTIEAKIFIDDYSSFFSLIFLSAVLQSVFIDYGV